ncbi:hypothetical protein M404DRAFT_156060, partial [Pisolithus tinctorius Marx 270]
HFFQCKHRVPPDVFSAIVDKIETHPVFHNNSNNPQLPVPIQLAIFLNAATSQDMAEWAGVSVGTVYNCYKQVMVAILHHHDELIHFKPEDPQDRREKERAESIVEERTCPQWRGILMKL